MSLNKLCVMIRISTVCVFGCKAYNFDQLRDGDLKLHSDRIRDILHWSDELVISSEQFPEEPVLCLGWKAVWTDRKGEGSDKEERGRQSDQWLDEWMWIRRKEVT